MTPAQLLEQHRRRRAAAAVQQAVEALKASPAARSLADHAKAAVVAAVALGAVLGVLVGIFLAGRPLARAAP